MLDRTWDEAVRWVVTDKYIKAMWELEDMVLNRFLEVMKNGVNM